ncbi:hypothetical protein L596_013822 [Steinernema carpocapsae]|uniref:Uncharacterized protein n=1 Tax=Steinernema carpocapsae TaxID=34508 RepID=A0A4U5P1X0_STECR|nr:hypothetical protein L596_013822 [Steinernema carpocapsae]
MSPREEKGLNCGWAPHRSPAVTTVTLFKTQLLFKIKLNLKAAFRQSSAHKVLLMLFISVTVFAQSTGYGLYTVPEDFPESKRVPISKDVLGSVPLVHEPAYVPRDSHSSHVDNSPTLQDWNARIGKTAGKPILAGMEKNPPGILIMEATCRK